MSKFHINGKGVAAPCKAKGRCPLGGDSGTENHFDSEEACQTAADKINESEYGILPRVEKQIGVQVAVLRGEIDPDKFIVPSGNQGNNKPDNGGFWTSSKDDKGESAWTKYTRGRMFYRKKHERVTWDMAVIKPSPEARVLTIDTAEDYQKVIDKYKEPKDKYDNKMRFVVTSFGPDELLDYDLLMEDYDAITITDNAVKENPTELSHFSCESTLWFNLDSFESVDYLEKGYKEKDLL